MAHAQQNTQNTWRCTRLNAAGVNTIGDILAASARQYADRIAIVGYHQGLNFRTIDRLTNKFANALRTFGRAHGGRVGVLLANRWEYAVAYFGIARAGFTSVHIPARFSRSEFEHVLKTMPLEALIIDDGMRDRFNWAAPFLADSRIIIAGGRTGGEVRMLATLCEEATDDPPDIAIDPGSVSSILFAGSATGNPRGILHTHAGRILSSQIALSHFGLQADDVIAVTMPLHDTDGLCTWFQAGVLAGASAVLLADWDPEVFAAAVSTLHITCAFVRPAHLAALIRHPSFDANRLSSLRLIVCAGATIHPVLIAAIENALPHARLVKSYGRAETGPLFAQEQAHRRVHPGPIAHPTIGHPNGRIDVALFVSQGRRAAVGEIGEIATRGRHVSPGYFGDDAGTCELYRGGDEWAWTGDLALADEHGCWTLAGRREDAIMAGGSCVLPFELERIARMHPDVTDCAAFSVADAKWGELPAIAVVIRAQSLVGTHEIEALFTGPEIGPFKRPRAVFIVDALPYSPDGELRRDELRKLVPEY